MLTYKTYHPFISSLNLYTVYILGYNLIKILVLKYENVNP